MEGCAGVDEPGGPYFVDFEAACKAPGDLKPGDIVVFPGAQDMWSANTLVHNLARHERDGMSFTPEFPTPPKSRHDRPYLEGWHPSSILPSWELSLPKYKHIGSYGEAGALILGDGVTQPASRPPGLGVVLSAEKHSTGVGGNGRIICLCTIRVSSQHSADGRPFITASYKKLPKLAEKAEKSIFGDQEGLPQDDRSIVISGLLRVYKGNFPHVAAGHKLPISQDPSVMNK